jgi:hypothetical protein
VHFHRHSDSVQGTQPQAPVPPRPGGRHVTRIRRVREDLEAGRDPDGARAGRPRL